MWNSIGYECAGKTTYERRNGMGEMKGVGSQVQVQASVGMPCQV